MATKAVEPTPEVIAIEMAKDRELRREERQALTAIPAANLAAAPMRTSFIPQSMGEAMQLAMIMSRSTFVPGHCRGSEGNCLAIIMQASRWGMDPFAVANKAYFVKDGAPPAFEAQLINAVVNSSGALAGRLRIEFEGEGEKLRCTVRGFLRADAGDEKVRTQSISRISTRNSPLWKSDPEQQLGYYTTRAWARMHCPEVLLGVYTPDELEAEAPPIAVSSTPPRRQQIEQRQSLAEEFGDEIPAFDRETGEVHDEPRDSRGFSEVDEDVARELDAGEAEEEQEESEGEPEAEEPMWMQAVTKARHGAGKATTIAALKAVDAEWSKAYAAVEAQNNALAKEIDGVINARRKALQAASNQAKGGDQ